MKRAPIRSPLRRWTRRIVRGIVGLVVLTLVIGSLFEAIAWRRTLARFPAPARLVDIGGRKMFIDCRGSGSPTVVFEAGLDVGGAISWALVHDSVATHTRACVQPGRNRLERPVARAAQRRDGRERPSRYSRRGG